MSSPEFLINKHSHEIKICPNCGGKYSVDGGGQKGGTSYSVHVWVDPEGQKRSTGFCSSYCLARHLGVNIEDSLSWKAMKEWGIDPKYVEPLPAAFRHRTKVS